MFNAVSLRIIEREGISIDTLHGDTTSRLVFGYNERLAEGEAMAVNRGYTKDHRPEFE